MRQQHQGMKMSKMQLFTIELWKSQIMAVDSVACGMDWLCGSKFMYSSVGGCTCGGTDGTAVWIYVRNPPLREVLYVY